MGGSRGAKKRRGQHRRRVQWPDSGEWKGGPRPPAPAPGRLEVGGWRNEGGP
jgi:hypothetical protein